MVVFVFTAIGCVTLPAMGMLNAIVYGWYGLTLPTARAHTPRSVLLTNWATTAVNTQRNTTHTACRHTSKARS